MKDQRSQGKAKGSSLPCARKANTSHSEVKGQSSIKAFQPTTTSAASKTIFKFHTVSTSGDTSVETSRTASGKVAQERLIKQAEFYKKITELTKKMKTSKEQEEWEQQKITALTHQLTDCVSEIGEHEESMKCVQEQLAALQKQLEVGRHAYYSGTYNPFTMKTNHTHEPRERRGSVHKLFPQKTQQTTSF